MTDNEIIFDIYLLLVSGNNIPHALERLASERKININLIKEVCSNCNGKTEEVNGGITGEEIDEYELE